MRVEPENFHDAHNARSLAAVVSATTTGVVAIPVVDLAAGTPSKNVPAVWVAPSPMAMP